MNKYVVTFGSGQLLEGRYILIEAETMGDAKSWMNENYGTAWSFIYTWDDWQEWLKTADVLGIPTEKMLMRVVIDQGVKQ